jgi:hypothetical protein
MSFLLTKEKIVFAAALVVALSSFTGIRKPSTEDLPKIPPEESPRPPRVTVPVPALHPEKPLEASARDPFVPASAWTSAAPAKLGVLPEPALPRMVPTGRALVSLDKEPKASPDEADAPKEGGDK